MPPEADPFAQLVGKLRDPVSVAVVLWLWSHVRTVLARLERVERRQVQLRKFLRRRASRGQRPARGLP